METTCISPLISIASLQPQSFYEKCRKRRLRLSLEVRRVAIGVKPWQGEALHRLIRSRGSVRVAHGPPFLLQHGIEVLVPPLALEPHILAKMPFAAQAEALKQ